MKHEDSLKVIIQNIIAENAINYFAFKNGMMKKFHVNNFTIEKNGDSFKINGKEIEKLKPQEEKQIKSILSIK